MIVALFKVEIFTGNATKESMRQCWAPKHFVHLQFLVAKCLAREKQTHMYTFYMFDHFWACIRTTLHTQMPSFLTLSTPAKFTLRRPDYPRKPMAAAGSGGEWVANQQAFGPCVTECSGHVKSNEVKHFGEPERSTTKRVCSKENHYIKWRRQWRENWNLPHSFAQQFWIDFPWFSFGGFMMFDEATNFAGFRALFRHINRGQLHL